MTQLKLFDENLEHKIENTSTTFKHNQDYARLGYLNKQEKQLKQYVSDRNYIEFFKLSNELGHTYSDNDPLQEIYSRGNELIQMGEK